MCICISVSYFVHFTFRNCHFAISGLLGLKHVEVIAPKYVRRGADVRLSCHYDLEKETLYATKWYKGPPPFKEFFRFLPKETPPALAFNLPGVYVDVRIAFSYVYASYLVFLCIEIFIPCDPKWSRSLPK